MPPSSMVVVQFMFELVSSMNHKRQLGGAIIFQGIGRSMSSKEL